MRTLTDKPFGINLTLLPHAVDLDYDGYVRAIVDSQVKFVETYGNNPARYIDQLKSAGVAVIHKCVTVRHALKAESLGRTRSASMVSSAQFILAKRMYRPWC
ncbi:hypothetical protein ACJ6YJ_22630 [Pseudomonas marginalis]|uniref:hypothetical protein n=1 Tax=Pseudomonas TaxID=286 RepID=UPI00389B3729